LGDGSVKTESADPKPVGPYVAQKVQSEKFGQALLLNNGINFISLRISAPYGPGQKSRTVLNIFIERALKGLALLYHGTGSRQQTFTHIDDVVHAFDRAIESGASGIFNIAGSEFVTVKQLADLVVSIIPNCASEVRPSEIKDPQEGATAMFSITKARQILGWRPTVSLKTGLTSCIQGKRTN
jgi:UDP-glucose 4-epimerase